jgi:hypothetical protein
MDMSPLGCALTGWRKCMSEYKRAGNKRIECADGFSMSVQASAFNYCEPKKDNADVYTQVEVGFPSLAEPLLERYAEDASALTNTVYPFVPTQAVTDVCAKHGGIISGELPNGVAYLKAKSDREDTFSEDKERFMAP